MYSILAFSLITVLGAFASQSGIAQNLTGPHYGASVGTLSTLACPSDFWSMTGGVTDLGEAVFSSSCILEPNDSTLGSYPLVTQNYPDIYVRNPFSGVTELLSTTSAGVSGNGISTDPRTSADGRFVVFTTLADDIVTPDTNGFSDIILLDRLTGLKERCSTGLGGANANGDSFEPDVSDDGRYIVYYSTATNLVLADTNGFQDAFHYDRVTGVTTRVGTGPFTAQPNGPCHRGLRISGNGSLVIWIANATNLSSASPGADWDLFAWSPTTGLSELISIPGPGMTSASLQSCDISTDGNLIAYDGTSSTYGTFLVDVAAGTRRMVEAVGTNLHMSGDGRYLVGSEYFGALPFPFSYSHSRDVFRGDTVSGVKEIVTTSPQGFSSFGYNTALAMSPNGRYVLYLSGAGNIVPALPPGYHAPPITIITDMGPSRSLGPGTTGTYSYAPRTHVRHGHGSPDWGLALMYTYPSAPAYLTLKIGPPAAPTMQLGGEVYPWPADVVVSLLSPISLPQVFIAYGMYIPFAWEPSTPVGTQVQAQWVIADPANAFGATLSNAIVVNRP